MESYENRCGKLPLKNVHHSEAQRNKEQKGKILQSSSDSIMNSLTGCADVMFSVLCYKLRKCLHYRSTEPMDQMYRQFL